VTLPGGLGRLRRTTRPSHDEEVTPDEAVRALIVAYAARLDAGDLDGVAALFADAVVRPAASGTELRGREAVRRMYEPVILYADGTPRTQHVLGNLEVRVEAATATSGCTFMVLQARPARGLEPVLCGRYDDRFTRVDGRWRFTERIITPSLFGVLSDHMAPR
jgi:uncharacterized protein (TIGR02246 family)